jgi:hypothetical protein
MGTLGRRRLVVACSCFSLQKRKPTSGHGILCRWIGFEKTPARNDRTGLILAGVEPAPLIL